MLFIHMLYIRGGDTMKQFILTKKIAKHGNQAIIVIPKILEEYLKPQTIVKLTIDVLGEARQ